VPAQAGDIVEGIPVHRRCVVLINSNRMKPPVAPLGLEYIGGRLTSAGIEVRLVDLSFVEDPATHIDRTLSEVDPAAVGVSFRNTDDCFWPSGAWFVPELTELIATVRSLTDAPIVLGGCGFSLFAAPILERCRADLAVVGDGEETFLELVQCLDAGRDPYALPGLVYRNTEGRIVVNPPRLDPQPQVPSRRGIIDNARYLREGGMGAIETKRGCPGRCIYCADPLIKGRRPRCRPPGHIADEIESLLAQGIDVFHLCDSEFNIPPEHATAVCDEIIARGLGERIGWYTYASVKPFPPELAVQMRRAGCIGINFGVDSASERMLARLGRDYRQGDIRQAVEASRRAGIVVMLDLLLGGPGEDEDSLRQTIEFVKAVDPDRAGAATGVRIYPGTRLASLVKQQGPLETNPNLRGCVEGNEDFLRPVFYIDQRLGQDAAGLVCELIGQDERFFKPAPVQDDADYNYNENKTLTEAIAAGYRGAFWDILRRLAQEHET